jgi:hypothetical protein
VGEKNAKEAAMVALGWGLAESAFVGCLELGCRFCVCTLAGIWHKWRRIYFHFKLTS